MSKKASPENEYSDKEVLAKEDECKDGTNSPIQLEASLPEINAKEEQDLIRRIKEPSANEESDSNDSGDEDENAGSLIENLIITGTKIMSSFESIINGEQSNLNHDKKPIEMLNEEASPPKELGKVENLKDIITSMTKAFRNENDTKQKSELIDEIKLENIEEDNIKEILDSIINCNNTKQIEQNEIITPSGTHLIANEINNNEIRINDLNVNKLDIVNKDVCVSELNVNIENAIANVNKTSYTSDNSNISLVNEIVDDDSSHNLNKSNANSLEQINEIVKLVNTSEIKIEAAHPALRESQNEQKTKSEFEEDLKDVL